MKDDIIIKDQCFASPLTINNDNNSESSLNNF